MILGLKSVKGQLRLIEASLAIIFLFLYLSFAFSLPQVLPETKSFEMKFRIQNALKAIDKKEEFRKYVYANDSSSIENLLYPYLPRTINYKVLICSNSCSFSVEAKEVYSVSYLLATDKKTFDPREVIVYVWE